jgi:transposase-like protein
MSQKKKARVFSREFKWHAVERILGGEGVSPLARELKLRRKLLYEWKDVYQSGGVEALRTRGRPRQGEGLGRAPQAKTERGALLQARQRIAALEQKVGQQQLEIDFFAEALRRVEAVRRERSGRKEPPSIRSLKNKPRKAD